MLGSAQPVSGPNTAVSYTHLDVYKRQTLGLPNLPAKSLLLSDDITIPYPVPSILIAQFSFISLPHLIHSLTFYLPSPVHLYIYFPIFFRFNQHIVKLMRSSLVSPNVKGGQKTCFLRIFAQKLSLFFPF